jgi:hypothetical protein
MATGPSTPSDAPVEAYFPELFSVASETNWACPEADRKRLLDVTAREEFGYFIRKVA